MSSEPPQHDVLLSPANSLLVLLNFEAAAIDGAKAPDKTETRANAESLLRLAVASSIPVIAVHCGGLLSTFETLLDDNDVLTSDNADPWRAEPFVRKLEQASRKKLIFTGFATEESVTFAVMNALADGYDAYLVGDACGSDNERDHAAALARMTQAGAVAVTTRGVLVEWGRSFPK